MTWRRATCSAAPAPAIRRSTWRPTPSSPVSPPATPDARPRCVRGRPARRRRRSARSSRPPGSRPVSGRLEPKPGRDTDRTTPSSRVLVRPVRHPHRTPCRVVVVQRPRPDTERAPISASADRRSTRDETAGSARSCEHADQKAGQRAAAIDQSMAVSRRRSPAQPEGDCHGISIEVFPIGEVDHCSLTDREPDQKFQGLDRHVGASTQFLSSAELGLADVADDRERERSTVLRSPPTGTGTP